MYIRTLSSLNVYVLDHLQARLAKVFPSKYLVTTLTCLLGSLQCFVVGISLGHNRAEWRLKWDLQLLTVVYSVQ